MRPSAVTDTIRALAELHQAEIDKDTAFYSVGDLASRWGCAGNTVRAIPPSDLPYLNLGSGLTKTLRRYRPADVMAYEAHRLERTG